MNVATTTTRADPLTACSVGVLAATAAALAHETLGHGLGCLAVGGHVTLLTSIYFKCAGASWLTDAAGPVGGLILGLICLVILKVTKPGGWTGLAIRLSAIINIGWFAGQLVYCAALNTDDWAFVARGLGWSAPWRALGVVAGVGTYIVAARQLGAASFQQDGLRLAALAAAGSAALAGLLWAGAPVRGALEGVAAVGLAPAVILIAVLRRERPADEASSGWSRSWPWVVASSASYALFLAVQARGLGPLA